MTPLETILAKYRSSSMTEREKGTYFEEFIRTYFRNEPRFDSLYSDVWIFPTGRTRMASLPRTSASTKKIVHGLPGLNDLK